MPVKLPNNGKLPKIKKKRPKNQKKRSTRRLSAEDNAGPLPIEEEVDTAMIEYAKSLGITDPKFLRGRMSEKTCKAINNIKIRTR